MGEFDEILGVLESAAGESAVLATVVAVRGSTYRREGARLVIPEDGDPVGNVSGGCLEAELVDAAAAVRSSGKAQLRRFDLTADDLLLGWGMGCNGVVDVLLEPPDSARRLGVVVGHARRAGATVVVVTVVDGDAVGVRLFVHSDDRLEGTLGSAVTDKNALNAATTARLTGRSETVGLDPIGVTAFVEVVGPPPRLVVCGAGHDAVPLVRMAATLGWAVDVADDRPALLSRDRFPLARRMITTQPSGAAVAAGVDARTFAVVMSHHLRRDTDYVRSLVNQEPAYIGVLGPAARLDTILEMIRMDAPLPADARARIHGPAGLDLGAEGPEEIALAIMAEIMAVRRGATARFLRDRDAPIHTRPSAVRR